MTDGGTRGGSGPDGPRAGSVTSRLGFGLVCAAYLATTTAEALLSPIFPAAGDDLGLGLADAGLVFAVLAAALAVATLIGGLLLQRTRPVRVATSALVTCGAGSFVAAAAESRAVFLGAQILIGSGAGLLWPAAVKLVGDLTDPRRRGLSMGIFGTAFSGGLVLAAGLAALSTAFDWRWAFVTSGALSVAAALTIGFVPDRAPDRNVPSSGSPLIGLASILGLPSAVGVVGGVSQYATVSFLPVFAVEVWAISPAAAALVLVIARALSVPSKVVAGLLSDRAGPEFVARALGLGLVGAGLVWALVSAQWLAMAGAIAFAALVSGLFPLANQLAYDRSDGRGLALGVFRALQIGVAAVAGLVLGWSADRYGLRPTIAVIVVLPAALVGVNRGRLTAPQIGTRVDGTPRGSKGGFHG